MSGLQPWVQLFGGGAGWGLVALFVAMVFRGDVITRREWKAMQRRLTYLEMTQQTNAETIAAFSESVDTNNALIRAFLDVAEERNSS